MNGIIPYLVRLQTVQEGLSRAKGNGLSGGREPFKELISAISEALIDGDLSAADRDIGSLEGTVLRSGPHEGGNAEEGTGPDEVTRCHFCGEPVRSLDDICPSCGFDPCSEVIPCPNCNEPVIGSFIFCPRCSVQIALHHQEGDDKENEMRTGRRSEGCLL